MEKFREEFIDRKVRMANNAPHEEMPDCYPEINVIGTIVKIWNDVDDCEGWGVRWPENSVKKFGFGDWTWMVEEKNIELVEEENDIEG